jgi:hypothetical protein
MPSGERMSVPTVRDVTAGVVFVTTTEFVRTWMYWLEFPPHQLSEPAPDPAGGAVVAVCGFCEPK